MLKRFLSFLIGVTIALSGIGFTDSINVKAETKIDTDKLADFLEYYLEFQSTNDFYEGVSGYNDTMIFVSCVIIKHGNPELYAIPKEKMDLTASNYFGKKISVHKSVPPVQYKDGLYDMATGPTVWSEINGPLKVDEMSGNIYKVTIPVMYHSWPNFDDESSHTTKKLTGTAIVKQVPSSPYGFNLLSYYVGDTPPQAIVSQINSLKPVQAVVGTSPVFVNGNKMDFEMYTIDGSNYFKLRDIAYALNGTSQQFDVGYDAATKAIIVKPGGAYSSADSGLSKSGNGNKSATVTNSALIFNGQARDLTAYIIDGSNYFKLRDLGDMLGFSVGYDAVSKTITINTPNNSSVSASVGSDGSFSDYLSDVKINKGSYKAQVVKTSEHGATIQRPALPQGVIAIKEADFDGDSQNELLVIGTSTMKNMHGDVESLTAIMLEKNGDTIVEAAKCVIGEGLLAAEDGNASVFTKNINGETIIVYEHKELASHWSDGVGLSRRMLKYKNNAFVTVYNDAVEGSSFDDDFINRYTRNMQSLGFSVNNGFVRIAEQDRTIEVISSIDYAFSGSYEDVRNAKVGTTLPPILIEIK